MRMWVGVLVICLMGSQTSARSDEARTVSDSDSAYTTAFEETSLTEPTPAPVLPASEEVVLNRPWLMETALGPTAFVLDRKAFQFSLLDLRLLTFDSALPAASWIHYGGADVLTVGVGLGYDFGTGENFYNVNGWPVVAEVRLNFLNVANWSFGAMVAGRYQIGFNSAGGSGRETQSAVAGLMASVALSPRVRMHLDLQGIYAHHVNQWGYTTYEYSYDSKGKAWSAHSPRQVVDRFVGDSIRTRVGSFIEWRSAREHSFLFGILGHALALKYEFSRYLETAISLRAQLGYHFLSNNRFNLFAGAEIGPSLHLADPYGRRTFSGLDAAISTGINFIL